MPNLPGLPTLPPGLEPVAPLTPDSRVLRVRRGERELVLRWVGDREQVEAEWTTVARLHHPGLVLPEEWGEGPEGGIYLLRPFLAGETLDRAVQGVDPDRLVGWIDGLLAALEALHGAGLVHRDVKAANVIVHGDRAHLVDLDLVGRAGLGGRVAGSLHHLAPEVLLGGIHGPRADLFSLGATLALVLCGEPSPRFSRRFPGRSFWEAAELDPGDLPDPVAPLVRALLVRREADRPASAGAARELLPGGAGRQLPPLTLPPLAGREDFLRMLVAAEAREGGGGGGATVLAVSHPEEIPAVCAELHLAAAAAGRTVALRQARAEDDLRGLAPQGDGADLILLVAAEAFGAPTLAEALFPFVQEEDGGGELLLVLPAERAEALRRHASPALSEAESRRVRWEELPRLGVATLVAHLGRLTEDAAPPVAEALAQDLVRSLDGRQSEVDRRLAAAPEAGVLRPARTAYAILRETWPGEPVPPKPGAAKPRGKGEDGPIETAVAGLSPRARRLLFVLGWAPPGIGPGRVGRIAGLDPGALAEARADLRGVGALAPGVDPRGRPRPADLRWVEAATRRLPERTRRACLRRARAELAGTRASPGELARLDLATARTGGELDGVIRAADTLRRSGRLAAARGLAQGVVERAGSLGAGDRAEVLLARLDLAQCDADAARERLRRRFGEGLEEAPEAALLVGAEAAELGGRRGEARDLYRRVLSAEPGDADRLRALTGMGYAALLDGDPRGALEATEGWPRPGDPDEEAGTLLNLRVGALAKLGRFEEAEEHLGRALACARTCGDPTLVGRTELNRGFLDRRRGRVESAATALRRATEAFERTDNVKLRALAANNSGVIQRDRGDLAEACSLLERALHLRRRSGDTFGAASSLGSLALATLESGRVGRAGAHLGAAMAELQSGEHGAELTLLEGHRALALSIAGEASAARRLLGGPRWASVGRSHPLLAMRARAVARLAGGRVEEARSLVRQTCLARSASAGSAEALRALALWCAVEPESETARSALRSAAEEVGGEVRLTEAAWRTRDRGRAVGVERLRRWLEIFETAGRTDLVRVVSLELSSALERAADHAGRRRAQARAEEAAEALVEGLDERHAAPALATLELLAGGGGRAPERAVLETDWFLACNRSMAGSSNLEELLANIVDMALEVTDSRRGFLVLIGEGDVVEARVARGMDVEPAEPELRFSSSVVREAIREGAPVVSLDAGADERFARMESVQDLALRSVLCVPFVGDDAPSGAIYVDNDQRDALFDERDVAAVRALADQASIAIRKLRQRAEIEALNERLRERVDYQHRELEQARTRLRRSGEQHTVGGLIGESPAIHLVHELIERLAPTSLPVLVTGPSGTGKDLVARALHQYSERASGPFVVENVAALPATLMESALFGHIRGAFTGAAESQLGLFAEADGGTFFLDEIGDLPLALQAKLLRVIETGEFRPVGARKPTRVDVRIVAATHRPLSSLAEEGTFRADLYYRLNGGEIAVPSLTERVEDIPLLVSHFLDKLCREHGRRLTMSDSVMAALLSRTWPGEVRELANEVARLFFLSEECIDRAELIRPVTSDLGPDPMPASYRLEDVERAAVQRALQAAKGRRAAAAEMLGISRAGLYNKMRRLGL